ncbi:hypothetical protein LABALGNA3A7_09390 [Dellaglioa algida]|nr:hypothetical protein LABALGNA3A7_09390 [Dellaglioa algida]
MNILFTLLLLISFFAIIYYIVKRFLTRKKDPELYSKLKNRVWYALVIFIISIIGGVSTATPVTKSTSESPKQHVSKTTSTKENKNVIAFKKVLDSKPNMEEFFNKFYAVRPASDQSKIFDNLIYKAEITWSGTVIDPMSTRIAVIESSKFDNKNWNDVSTTDNVSYVVFVKGVKNSKSFKMGDKVKFTGTIESRGSAGSSKTNWDVQSSKISLN